MKKILVWFLFGLIIATLWRINQHGWLAVNFVDEQDNFVVGQKILDGEKIFSNIFTHHQPGAYIFSGLIQKVFNPNTIQSLIKQHRTIISIWSIGWIVFLGWRFGFIIMSSSIIFELIKKIYLGNMFLAESLVVAPIIYLVLVFLDNKKVTFLESFFIGLMLALVGITLAPMWPLVGIMGIGWIHRWRNDLKKSIFMVGGGIIVLGITLNLIDIGGYIQNAILINQKYYLSIAGGENLLVSFLKATISPLAYLVNGVYLLETWVIKILIILLIMETIFLVRHKKYRLVVWIWGLLALANLRNFEFEKIFYDGFHLLIWVGLIVTIPLFLIKNVRWFWGLAPIMVLLVISKNLIVTNPNYAEDFEIYYSRIFNMSEAIRLTKEEDYRLLAMPDEVLAYWQAKIKPAGRFIFFYKWMGQVPELKNEQLLNFESKPEYLIIKSDEKLGIGRYLDNYQNFMYRNSNKRSEFYIRKDIYDNFSEEKINRLNYYGLEAI